MARTGLADPCLSTAITVAVVMVVVAVLVLVLVLMLVLLVLVLVVATVQAPVLLQTAMPVSNGNPLHKRRCAEPQRNTQPPPPPPPPPPPRISPLTVEMHIAPT